MVEELLPSTFWNLHIRTQGVEADYVLVLLKRNRHLSGEGLVPLLLELLLHLLQHLLICITPNLLLVSFSELGLFLFHLLVKIFLGLVEFESLLEPYLERVFIQV